MDRERLTRLVQEPGRVAREDLAGLKALAEKYPWFSGAQLLRTAGERRSADVLFDETLRTTSAHLPSRSALYDLTTLAEQRPSTLHVVKPVPAQPAEPPKPLTIHVEAEILPPVEPVAEILAPPVPVEVVPVEVPPPAKEPVVKDLDEQILEAAMAGAYDLTLLEQIPRIEVVPVVDAPIVSAPGVVSVPEPVSQPPTIAANSRMRFTQWLDVLDEVAPTKPGTHVRPAVPAPSAEEVLASVADGSSLPPSELIDRFIRQETPEPKAKTAFFTPQIAGKRSLDDTTGLVTETLARIYEKQGNLPKAIETYRRLALKYPEKAAYFAALQKSLEDQQIK